MISHGNLTEAVRAITGRAGSPGPRAGRGCLQPVLPAAVAHPGPGGLRCAWCMPASGPATSPIPASCPPRWPRSGPTILLAVPRVLEKVAAAARQQAEAGGRQRLFAAAEAAAIAYSRAGRRPGVALRLRHAVFARLVYARLRQAIGGRVAWAISGGAPLSADLGAFPPRRGNHRPGGLGADRDRRPGDHEPARRAADRLGRPAAARLRRPDRARRRDRGPGPGRVPAATGRTRRPPPRRSTAGGCAPGTSGGLDDDGFVLPHRQEEGADHHRVAARTWRPRCSKTGCASTG